MTSREYIITRSSREDKALEHDMNMWDKYAEVFRRNVLQEKTEQAILQGLEVPNEVTLSEQCEINEKAFNSKNWWDWVDCNGEKYKQWDLRKPYSREYFTQFMKELMNCSLGNIKRWLLAEFLENCENQNYLDEIDRDYLEGLLTEAEIMGRMHMDGSLLAIYGSDDWASYDSEPGLTLTRIVGATTWATLHGGEDYRRRAGMIRKWCEEWKLIEESIKPSEHSTPLAFNSAAGSTQVEENQGEIDSKKPRNGDVRKLRGGEETSREDIQVDIEAGLPTAQVDSLAKHIHLCPPGVAYIKQADGHTRIWVLAEALKAEECATVSTSQLAQMLGRRYGYVVGPKLTDKKSKTNYLTLLDRLRTAIKNL